MSKNRRGKHPIRNKTHTWIPKSSNEKKHSCVDTDSTVLSSTPDDSREREKRHRTAKTNSSFFGLVCSSHFFSAKQKGCKKGKKLSSPSARQMTLRSQAPMNLRSSRSAGESRKRKRNTSSARRNNKSNKKKTKISESLRKSCEKATREADERAVRFETQPTPPEEKEEERKEQDPEEQDPEVQVDQPALPDHDQVIERMFGEVERDTVVETVATVRRAQTRLREQLAAEVARAEEDVVGPTDEFGLPLITGTWEERASFARGSTEVRTPKTSPSTFLLWTAVSTATIQTPSCPSGGHSSKK